MTLVRGHNEPVNRAETHVLIIGVNDYPNSKHPQAWACTTATGVSKLTSPTLSARALADWFLTEFHNSSAPLGSLDLLLSEAVPETYQDPKTKHAHAIGRADFVGIQTSFQNWETRCNSDPGNVAAFYFCGHAAEGCNRILLPSDFPILSQHNEPDWNQVVNFNATCTAMEYCLAAHQFYFLDCCRTQLPPELASSPLGVALRHPRLGSAPKVRAQPVFTIGEYSTTGAARDQISGFTDLLLLSLRGAAAELRGGRWQVTAQPLLEAFQRIKEVFHEAFQVESSDISRYPSVEIDVLSKKILGTATLHHYRPKAPPMVPACIRCDPERAAFAAQFAVANSAGIVPLKFNKSGPYAHGFLKRGRHEFQVTFPGGVWQNAKKRKSVEPPVCECRFEAEDV
jgi:hypothetical protein